MDRESPLDEFLQRKRQNEKEGKNIHGMNPFHWIIAALITYFILFR